MFLKLNHQKLDIYQASRQFVIECYTLKRQFPVEEKFGMISQIRRAALSVHLNIVEGASRKSEAERKRYFEIARGSVIEVDAAFEIANQLNYLKEVDMSNLELLTVNCFKMLTGLLNTKIDN